MWLGQVLRSSQWERGRQMTPVGPCHCLGRAGGRSQWVALTGLWRPLKAQEKGSRAYLPGTLVLLPSRGGCPWSQRPPFSPSSQHWPPPPVLSVAMELSSQPLPVRAGSLPNIPTPLPDFHATPLPNLAIGLGPLPSSWQAPKSPPQPTNFPEKFLPPLWFPAMSNQQHDTQKGSSVLGKTSQS